MDSSVIVGIFAVSFWFSGVMCEGQLNQSSTVSSIMKISTSPVELRSSSIHHIPSVEIAKPVSEAPSVTTETVHKIANSTNTTMSPTTASLNSTVTSISSPLTTKVSPTANLEIDDKCPALNFMPDLDILTQDELLLTLTDNCRYDRLIKPPTREPLEVLFQFDMNHVETPDHLQLKAHMLVQLLYNDSRLAFSHLSPNRLAILGGESLRDRIWVPHIIIDNERESNVMGLDGKDVSVQISPNGDVIYSYRMSTTFYCWMNLQKFPFDNQICELKWVSWDYNVTNLILKWERTRPFLVASNLHLTEFVMEKKWTDETVIQPAFNRGGLVGNYSSVVFKFLLRREIGHYIMDYYIPSILLVCTSWVTFWLQADAAPPRVTLGTATMLSFITLNGGLSKNLPKVSYIKASEIWFLACSSFIFFSLAEFAFVNVIWRRRKKVELKKQNGRYILKGALTPSLARKQMRKAASMNTLHKARSCSSLDKEQEEKNSQNNYLTVHSFPIPKIAALSHDDLMGSKGDSIISIPNSDMQTPDHPTWTTMSPQEVAMWIDKKSRIVFPVTFLIFNLFYWSFVYAL
ncbi:pH-sensitive chloride channel 2 isoform X1 [Leptinotarsa decemlineata]|uniref:pH-sensitive chloride channel 2 isoform X1 n=1 Tax=Leptinotarsa decemlineata TaxID=7539 RepID=UPI003D30CAF3